MKTRFCIATAAVVACAGVVHAEVLNASYGWEDGGTVLGSYGNFHSDHNSDPNYVRSGNGSLYAYEDPLSGTPQGFAAWITGLSDGDVIDASFFAWDDTIGSSPSLRIWGHYTSVGGTIDDYSGSAGGNTTYSGQENIWEELSHSWTFDSDGGERDGFVVEIRIYASSSAGLGHGYVDDMTVSVSGDDLSGTVINTPVPAPGALALLGLAGFARRRRR
jgi:MYXO-CTERM domain-containing protein